ncbi:alpha-2-macroglobulin 1 [Pelobates cultripes]|uniref:Alpha-2-macroglobulin 1 n=1 Tax=Pelobates cultripes TaxID=61616 RepID=A0AAD1WUY8_PELCU|nr:alpha-2-macroglobulin 1 [Pelobates cultripes]
MVIVKNKVQISPDDIKGNAVFTDMRANMQLLLVLASLFIFCSAAEETSEPHYVVIVPNQLSYPSTEKTCVVFYHLKGPVNFKIEMNNGNSDRVELVTEDKIDGPNYFQCYSFQVPAISKKYEMWNFKISGEADGLKINRTKTVFIVKLFNSYIIQTDKYIYTPGQAVHFRIVTLDRDFRALNEKLPLVEIMDPNGNRIGQWRDISPKSGISDFSFQLSEDLPFGDYTINIPKQKSSIFSVAKFIPQKIELKINLPWKIVPSDESFSLEICGRYTFGKPLKGSLKIYVCELLVNPLEGDDDYEDDGTKHSECQYIWNAQTNSRGCFTGEIDIRYFNLSTKPHIRQLTVSTSIKEKHTGLVEKASNHLRIGSAKIIYFEDLEYYYYRGIPYNGVITVIDRNKKRIPNEVFYLIVKVDNVKTNISLVTNEEGVAHFELDTTDWVDVVNIKGVFNFEEYDQKYDGIETQRSIFPFYSPRKSLLKVEKMSTVLKKLLCNTMHSAKIEYRINVNDLPPELNELSVIYVLSSRKSVALHGEYKVDVRAPLSGQYLYGSFHVNFPINKELFPYANLLVFTVLRNGNMIGDYTSLTIPYCFVNQVKLEFSEKVVHPRKRVGLEITAESGSICSIRSVDKGQLLHRPFEQLSKSIVQNLSFGYRQEREEKEREISLNVPDIWVPGSERADIIVFGDILNNAIANVDDIIDLPTGCGEQNMARAAVSLHILQYLNNTKQLTTEIENRLLKHLTVGYQKQLTFQTEKGSYSIFSGENGNGWLTAFVVKCLSQAQNFIYIDEKIIQGSVKWLSSLQLPNGCFNISGNYYNNRIQDEETHEITLTAFVTIALMESGNIMEDGVIVNALSCLRKGAERVNNTYTESLLAYVFSLSGDNGLRQLVLEDLEKKATNTDLFKHWEIEDSRSGNIEITSYVLLALLEQQLSSKEIEEATKIMNWILQQQNLYGGFSSTQDTVVAFQAMSGFAKSTFVPRGDTYVNVKTLSGFQEKFIVDKSSNILQQKASLPDVRGEYTVTVTGGSCVYVQTHLQYHIPVAKVYSNFAISVSTLPSVCTFQAHASFDIVAELSYTGNRVSSNMVIVEAELLSGFIPKKSSVTLLLNNPNVKKTEIKEDKIIIYLSEITHDTQTLLFSIKQITHVNNLRPAAVMVYDYYEPEEYAVAEYTFPCEKAWGHCPSNVSERKECGYPSISSEECLQRHCCYDSSVSETPWCFFRKGHTE